MSDEPAEYTYLVSFATPGPRFGDSVLILDGTIGTSEGISWLRDHIAKTVKSDPKETVILNIIRLPV